MLDSTTMALRAALLVSKGFANTNRYGYSVGSIGSMVVQNGNQISYVKGSVGTLSPQQVRLTGGITRERIEAAIRYNANKPIGTLSEKVIVETGEQTASESANKIALKNVTGGGSRNNTSAQEDMSICAPIKLPTFPTNGESTTAPTQQQAQVSFFERNKTTILIVVVLIVVAALFLWKK